MVDRNCTVFVLGPPAAGKTTIGRLIGKRLGRPFRSIDDWTPHGVRMTDEDVHIALGQLFNILQPSKEIVEFCHHAYGELIKANTYPLFTSAPKVVVTAPLDVCKARNALRRSPVREEYVERAWHSTERLVQYEQERAPNSVLVVNTVRAALDAAVAEVASFLSTIR